ncbi:5-(carboxyamino)imidazole ribonucleotide synthase [Microscilla marina]|uniref:N5-carboxyaminoimidazole ribonucleotide synthase n=1 Tax=Microscilla marina ATCC 23134 TaxID=313606 RepID=A1ZLM0_MICM2|nr:5-(carboxyamino)imidazole ribonucleotide synthase [Microscilla marina]EAY28774.1 phosphoribosylaminoimidazole carboxylase, ATPase subunit [Microscilla marina ATCC 23134]
MQKVGILGGGQLGRMLIQAGIDFDLDISVLDPDPNAPCKLFANRFEVGKLTDFDTVYQFGQTVDVLTIEIESVNVDALEKLHQEGKKVFPQPQVIRTIQDKRLQKQFYQTHQIPSPEFVLIDNKGQLADHADFLPAFQKLGKDGYDGRGVQKLTSPNDFEHGFDKPSLLEKLVDIDKEISVIVARNESGGMRTFPVVELVFHPAHNLVDYLLAPAQITPEQAAQAEALAQEVMLKLDMVGLLAIELFLTKEGKILVNEVAPRPHNSGHHTIKANGTSQYEQLWRAILNLPLGDTSAQSLAAMVNVLGASGHTGNAHYEGVNDTLGVKGAYLHLYGKKLTKPSRKMGHVTILDQTLQGLEEKIDLIKRSIKVVSK